MHQAVSHQARMSVQVPGLVEKRPNVIIGDIVYLRQVPAGTHSSQDLQDESAQQVPAVFKAGGGCAFMLTAWPL